jgi:hypothetical protein
MTAAKGSAATRRVGARGRFIPMPPPGPHPDGVRRHALVHLRDEGGERYIEVRGQLDLPVEELHPLRERFARRQYQDNTPGLLWCHTTGDYLEYESWLEAQWLMLLDFDTNVQWFVTQPIRFDVVDRGQVWQHVPDVLARLANGRLWLIDVKPTLRHRAENVVLQRQRTERLCAELGWTYTLVGDLPRPRIDNVKWLRSAARDFHCPDRDRIEQELIDAAAIPVRFDELVAQVRPAILSRPVLTQLLWRQQLLCDLDSRLTGDSLVWRT